MVTGTVTFIHPKGSNVDRQVAHKTTGAKLVLLLKFGNNFNKRGSGRRVNTGENCNEELNSLLNFKMFICLINV